MRAHDPGAVVVAVDGSDGSRAALRWAVATPVILLDAAESVGADLPVTVVR